MYITRDFGFDSDKTYYYSIKEGDKINIKIIGKRFEMNDKHIQIIGFLVQPKKERISLTSHSKKPQSLSAPILTTESVTSSSTSSGGSATMRASRKTKNPLSIVNDTNNNVITITYDATIDLPSEPKAAKTPKTPKVPKEPKEPKEPKASTKVTKVPKEPKTKAPKKENSAGNE